jgi:hypothetical protein
MRFTVIWDESVQDELARTGFERSTSRRWLTPQTTSTNF